jgi:hypothetical protein
MKPIASQEGDGPTGDRNSNDTTSHGAAPIRRRPDTGGPGGHEVDIAPAGPKVTKSGRADNVEPSHSPGQGVIDRIQIPVDDGPNFLREHSR